MSALLLKDYYVIFRQMKIFLLLILVFSCIPGTFYSTFAVVYASMLPYTALAYDERSKWDQLAAMMPYSARDVVLSKYLFGWISVAVAAAATFEVSRERYDEFDVGGRKAVLMLMLDHESGVLSKVLNRLTGFAVNILTITQSLPIHDRASVTISMDISELSDTLDAMLDTLSQVPGVESLRLVAVE